MLFRSVGGFVGDLGRDHRLLGDVADESGLTLYLVHNVTEQSVISSEITDETTHESTLFETGSWLSGRLSTSQSLFVDITVIYPLFTVTVQSCGFEVYSASR